MQTATVENFKNNRAFRAGGLGDGRAAS